MPPSTTLSTSVARDGCFGAVTSYPPQVLVGGKVGAEEAVVSEEARVLAAQRSGNLLKLGVFCKFGIASVTLFFLNDND